jgi:hypothetical protein
MVFVWLSRLVLLVLAILALYAAAPGEGGLLLAAVLGGLVGASFWRPGVAVAGVTAVVVFVGSAVVANALG